MSRLINVSGHKERPRLWIRLYIHLYGVATISRLLQIVGLFCRVSSLLKGFFAKETYNLKESTNRSNPIAVHMELYFLHMEQYFLHMKLYFLHMKLYF